MGFLLAQFLLPASPTATATSDFESQVVDLINQERAAQGLAPLTPHYMLANAAEAHSNNMTGGCGHAEDWVSNIVEAGYTPYSGLAENVACGQATPEQVVSAWMSSAGHRDNILGDYQHIGVGYHHAPGSFWGHYWTVDFGKPAPGTPPPCELAFDFDQDGVIEAGDVSMVSAHWNGEYDATYDVNVDQWINIVDLTIVSSEWGTHCP